MKQHPIVRMVGVGALAGGLVLGAGAGPAAAAPKKAPAKQSACAAKDIALGSFAGVRTRLKYEGYLSQGPTKKYADDRYQLYTLQARVDGRWVDIGPDRGQAAHCPIRKGR